MHSKRIATVVLAATVMGAFGMSGCDANNGAETTTQTATTHPRDADSTALLVLNDKLQTQLGSEYSGSWIEDNTLHVAVTTEAAKKIVTDAGAVPSLVTFDAAQLETALQSVATWQAKLPQNQAGAIHRIVPDAQTGTLTIYVAADQIDVITQAAKADKPAGTIPLIIKVSSGVATAS